MPGEWGQTGVHFSILKTIFSVMLQHSNAKINLSLKSFDRSIERPTQYLKRCDKQDNGLSWACAVYDKINKINDFNNAH